MAGLTWLACLGAAATARATDNVTYQGGPVAHSMRGVIVDWGSGVNAMYTNGTTGDPGLIKYLAAQSGSTGDIGGVIAQYMDSSGQNAANLDSYGQQYAITPSVTGTTISDSQIKTELVNQIDATKLPHPAGDGLSTIYLVLFPSGDIECADATDCSANDPNYPVFCAYHSSTQLPDGTNVLYAVLPDNTTGPMSADCGNAPTLLDDQTSFVSHEWSEAITDPLGTAWWVNNSSSPESGYEIGDSCNQLMTSEGGWTVQELWSNLDGNCMGNEPAYAAPTASFLGPTQAAPNQLLSFDASSSTDPAQDSTAMSGTSYSIPSGIAGYRWNWGDGSSSTTAATATATHTYLAAGDYQVSLTVTDKLGFTSTVTHQVSVTVNGIPNPSAATGGTTNVSATGATLQGAVNSENQSTQYEFVYGTSPTALTASTPKVAGPAGQTTTQVSASISALQGSTTYYYELEVFAGGQTYYGGVQSFTTNAAPPPPQTPVAATGGAAAVTTDSAVVSGTVDPGGAQPVTYWFSYGTSPSSLGSSTSQTSETGTTSVPVSTILTGLSAGTTYYFRLDVSFGGQTYSGTIQSFTTRAVAPGVSTGLATVVSSDAATVTGSVSPGGAPTSYLVEFGTTAAYGHSSPMLSAGSGTGTVPVTVSLTGLRSRTLYHYRFVAISAGGTSVGGDRTFRTGAPPAPAPRFSFAVSLGRRLRVHFRCSRACTARFAVTVASGLTRFTPVAVTLARGTGTIHARGRGTVSIRLSASVRRRVRRGALKLVVVGYATSRGSARSAPLTKPVR